MLDTFKRRLAAAIAAAVLALVGGVAVVQTQDEPQATSSTAVSTYVVPAEIDATCTDDVTQPLLAFVATVPDGSVGNTGPRPSTIQFQSSGCYRVEGVLEIVGRNLLTFDGLGATFKATITAPAGMTTHQIRARSMWRIRGGSKIALRHMTVVGAHPHAGIEPSAYDARYEAQMAFDLLGVAGVDLGPVTATDVWGDFVYVGPNAGVGATDVVVHDSTFSRNGRQCLTVTWGSRIVFERLDVGECRRATLDVEPNWSTAVIDDVTLRDSQIGRGRLLALAMGGAAAPVTNVVLERNIFTGRAMNLAVLNPTYCEPGSGTCTPTTRGLRRGIVVRDNVSDTAHGNPTGYVLTFRGADDVVVQGNTQPTQAGRDMYLAGFLDVCGENDVSGNIVPNGLGELIVKTPCTAE